MSLYSINFEKEVSIRCYRWVQLFVKLRSDFLLKIWIRLFSEKWKVLKQ